MGFLATSAAVARGNRCNQNTHTGIVVVEQAQPRLEQNVVQGNGWSGISYEQTSGGTAASNTVEQNSTGIQVSDDARPVLEGNVCRHNAKMGILYQDRASGIASGNISESNGFSGIGVVASARPKLQDNRCRGNQQQDVRDERSWLNRR